MKLKEKTKNFKSGFTPQSSTAGFTLIETLVAITILVSAIAGPLTIASRSLFSAQFTKNQIIASYLAQDAVEYVRNLRDENVLSGQAWLQSLLPGVCNSKCRVDSANDNVQGCGGSCPPIKRDSASGLYGYQGSWDDTIFTRDVTLSEVVSGEEATISVTISWTQGSASRSYTIRENIFNWNN